MKTPFAPPAALALALGFALGTAGFAAAPPVRLADGIEVAQPGGWLRLTVRADDMIRVAFSRDRSFFDRPSLAVQLRPAAPAAWSADFGVGSAVLRTSRLQARVDYASGAVSFLDPEGRTILAESPGGRSLEPAVVQGVPAFHARQTWVSSPGESLYGLGQQQLGVVDIKGLDLDLWQRNTVVVVPFLVSSRGYGILWDNPSFTRFGDLRPFVPVEPEIALPRRGPRGRSEIHRWNRLIVPPTTGDYQFRTYSNGGIKVWIDGRLRIDRWRQGWLPEYDQVRVPLEAGVPVSLAVEAGGEQSSILRVCWKTPPPQDSPASLWSEVADGVDYTFVYGPKLDRVVSGYRRLTGRASLLPRWAFGLWQSRQRYETSEQSLDVVREFRRRGLPLDTIVQDWMYWPENAWGSHRFDPVRFPDPDGWIRQIHDLHARVMISVWGKFYSGSYPGDENFRALEAGGYLYQPTLAEGVRDWVGPGYNFTFYDAFSPGGRKLFWDQIDAALFRRGIDAWWMDASEPDVVQPSPSTLEKQQHFIGTTALGPASRVLNAYALENSRAVYEGQRAAAPGQRVFILTRSGYAGIQRYGTATWSGDVTSTWTSFARQIAAGLGYSISGVPYWTSDSGGYTMQARFAAKPQRPEDAAEWRELNARWFEFAAFCPLTRLHGELQPREPWTFGGDRDPAYLAIAKFDRLRYRMLPYVYSVAGSVTRDDSTMMRPLVMDFPGDPAARTVSDEYLFGPELLVAPVTSYRARSRWAYLPRNPGGWFDFWTGAAVAGGGPVSASAPLDSIPLYVRAGSILPFGPDRQFTSDTSGDPLTIRVYSGADGDFVLYEDDGVSTGYERGEYARIPIHWSDGSRTLTIGGRIGSYPGMSPGRAITAVLIAPGRPAGFSFGTPGGRTVRYDGDPVTVSLP